MRITPSMFGNYPNRISPLAYTRHLNRSQSLSRNKGITSASSTGNRLGNNNSTAVDKYVKLGESAESLRTSSNVLSSVSKNSIFENARATGSKDAIYNQVRQMVSGFNSTMSGMKNDNSSLNRVYRQLMENSASENSNALSKIGITVNADRTLSIDETKFRSSSIDDLEAALGSKSGFSSRVGSVAENVSKNAISTATNLSSTYRSYGALGASYGFNGLLESPYNSYAGMGYGKSNYLAALLAGTSRFNLWG